MKRTQTGFTLAELLISLAILGVIATFTIPKVLTAGTNGQNTAKAKEAASMISGAFSAYSLSTAPVDATTAGDFFDNNLNYVARDTSSATTQTGLPQACAAPTPCYKLHNGGIIQYAVANNFGTDQTKGALIFNFDPDAAGTSGTPVSFVLFRNGRITTLQAAGTANVAAGGTSATTVVTDPAYIATW